LAVRLGIPIYGCDPSLVYLGTKSGSRRAFLKAGVPMPPGAENLKTYEDIVHAVAALKDMYPDLKKAVIKLNDGFSGDGNAILYFPDHITKKELFNWFITTCIKKLFLLQRTKCRGLSRKIQTYGRHCGSFCRRRYKSFSLPYNAGLILG
jgi:hypothetical protein